MARWLRSSVPGPTATRRSAVCPPCALSPILRGILPNVPRDGGYPDDREFLQVEERVDGPGEPLRLARGGFRTTRTWIINNVRNGASALYPINIWTRSQADASVPATELGTTGPWHRAAGGYEVLDRGM